MIVIDSGLGGISVVRALRAADSARSLIYVADTAAFPYGARSPAEITTGAKKVISQVTARHETCSIVLACNTLSTLCLEALRAEFPFSFVGTVPAIKVAAGLSHTRRFTLLATPNTANSPYSNRLIAEFASDCLVDCYGAPNLAAMAERMMLGDTVPSDALRAELAPAFHDDARGRTDAIVLGCTHYPLMVDALRAAAPWEVRWIDSSEAIARRALTVADDPPVESIAYVTAAADVARYAPIFAREGFARTLALTG